MTRIPSEAINICVDFIKDNDLGQVDLFDAQRKYDELEKERLHYLLDICTKIINSETQIDNINNEIKEKLKITDDLTKIISDKLKIFFSSYEKMAEAEKELKKSPTINLGDGKKNIFSVIINKKN